MSEATREQLEAELVALRSQNAAQAGEIERLTRMITELEQRLDKGSKNSSVPPSADSPKKRAEATKTCADRRAEVKAKRKDDVERRRGKHPGTPGASLAMRPDPDEIVNLWGSTTSVRPSAGRLGASRRVVVDRLHAGPASLWPDRPTRPR
jgi:Family of unknown function (DUF6444)